MVATYRQQSDPPLARLEQPRNYATGSFERAVYTLAMRAVKAGVFTTQEIAGMLQALGFEYVPDRTIRSWIQKNPFLPEMLIVLGAAQPGDFPHWCRGFLQNTGSEAPMAQESGPVNKVATENEEMSTRYVVGVTIVVWLGIKFLKAIFRDTDNPSDSSQQSISIHPAPWL